MDKKVWGKTELVDKVAEKAGMTKKDAKAAIEAAMEVIKDSVKGRFTGSFLCLVVQ